MKKEAILLALAAVFSLFEKYENQGVKIDTQEADFKAVKNQVMAALEMPDDAATEAQAVAQSNFEKMVTDKLEGFEDALGAIIHLVTPEAAAEPNPA
jgi:hypothetical protein